MDDVVSALTKKDENNKNYLSCSSEVLDLDSKYFPESLKISTLADVASSAQLYEKIATSTFGFKERYDIEFEDFQFHERTWTMTTSQLRTRYNKKPYEIITFKLPNDGFIYSTSYSAGGLEVKKNNPEVADFISRVSKAVLQIKGFPFDELRINYRPAAGNEFVFNFIRFLIYCFQLV